MSLEQSLQQREETLIDDIIHDLEAFDFNSPEARNVVKSHIHTEAIKLVTEAYTAIEVEEKDISGIGDFSVNPIEWSITRIGFNKALSEVESKKETFLAGLK